MEDTVERCYKSPMQHLFAHCIIPSSQTNLAERSILFRYFGTRIEYKYRYG